MIYAAYDTDLPNAAHARRLVDGYFSFKFSLRRGAGPKFPLAALPGGGATRDKKNCKGAEWAL